MESTHRTLIKAGEPCAIVRVKNLQSTVSSASDAWGRQDRPQPVLVSVEASFRQKFLTSATSDVVSADTVHYGVLSKEILKYLEGRAKEPVTAGVGLGLTNIVEGMWTRLVGCNLAAESQAEDALLKPAKLRHLVISVKVPKGTLLGGGVSLTATATFSEGIMLPAALALKTHELRVPTLIGVNDNERKAKQVVVASIEVDKYQSLEDEYVPLEALVTKTMMDSSFETLEALALILARVAKGWLVAHSKRPEGDGAWKLTVTLEKPVAVPFADASCVELIAYTNEI